MKLDAERQDRAAQVLQMLKDELAGTDPASGSWRRIVSAFDRLFDALATWKETAALEDAEVVDEAFYAAIGAWRGQKQSLPAEPSATDRAPSRV